MVVTPCIFKLFALLAVASFCLMSAAVAQQPLQLRGYVVAKTVDCLNPKNHHHEPLYFLEDDATGERVSLKGYEKQLRAIDPRQKVSIRGVRRNKAADAASGQKSTQPQKNAVAGSEGDVEIQQFEVLPMAGEAEAEEPPLANGANTLTMLSTLLVFISTDTHACMTSETNARGRLFNNATNANMGMQAITKGRYGLQLGNGTGVPDDHTIDLRLNVNSAEHDTGTIEDLALEKLFSPVAFGGMGLDRLAWNRILLFAPGGITNSGFTAYAYYPGGLHTTSGLVSMYGSSYGNNRLNGYLHELGHNFGFAHSSKGGSEYGDRTCVMGSSNDGTRTETYNAVKLLEKDWLDAFTDAKKAVTTDTTIDLYPLSSDPNIGTIAVSFPGTDYYAAYHRNQEPYGFLTQTADRDRVFVYTRATGTFMNSYQVANLGLGNSFTGPGTVRVEHYGPNNAYATVSFDMNDGNTKPVANAQSISATINTAKAITLTGSDANSDALTYTKVTDPANGVLSGTVPNLTYTPNNNYLGADSFVFKVHDGKISSFATISITVNPANVAPVANYQSVNVFLNTPQPITLSATDANGHSLTYSVVSGPSKGILTGTPPNLTYTPNNNLSGSDSFTFKANDTFADSNTATVSISISTSPNTPPTVNAGLDQTTYLAGSVAVPGITFAPWTSDADSGISSSKTYTAAHSFGSVAGTVTVNGVAFPESLATSGTGWSIAGTVANTSDATVNITGQSAKLAQRFIYNGNPRTITFTGLTPGKSYETNLYSVAWETGTRQQTFSVTGGASAIINQSVYNENNGIRISCIYTATATTQVITITPVSGSGTFHLYAMTNHLKNGLMATVNLNGTVTDGEQIPTGSWSVISGSAAAVSFGDFGAIDTTASFTEAGTYVLRLTGDDGYQQSTSDVTITVNPPLPALYASWAGGSFANPFNALDPAGNQDGDQHSNLMEFAFGTDPTLQDATSLATNGSVNGSPVPRDAGGGVFEYCFMRRKDYGTSGSVNYTVQFSNDLSGYTNSVVVPTFVANSSVNANYEVVKVPFPDGFRFGRVGIEIVP